MKEVERKERVYYDTTLSQDVTTLQCKYTLFKRIMNILTSVTAEEELDFEILKQAFNKVVERNDCLRLRFEKKDGKLMQYFLDEVVYDDIKVLEFKTKKEQEKFINSVRRKTIGYLKGEVATPYFIKTYDGRSMILLKVAHLILDIYGINMIYKDLLAVYNALKNKTEMPEMPVQFEELVKLDLKRKFDDNFNKKNEEFYKDYFNDKEEPYFTGLGGINSKVYKKLKAKNMRPMKMLFFSVDTKGYEHKIDKEITDGVVEYCRENNMSVANFLFYACSLTAAKINGNATSMLPLQLCNCRGSYDAKQCAGMRVQSLSCYTAVNYEKTFLENLVDFTANQNLLYRHLGYSDFQITEITHKTYNTSPITTYFSLAFSFITFALPDGYEFFLYSNEKSVLPAYLALLYDVKNGNIIMDYDVQTKIISEQEVANFHKSYVCLLKEILTKKDALVKDLKTE